MLRLLGALALASLLPGCILCGPTEYALSGVTATARFDEPWNATRVEAGLRAAGFEPTSRGETAVRADRGNRSVEASGGPGGTTLYAHYGVAQARGSFREVERAADAAFDAHDAEADALVAAFASGAGWTRDGAIEWQKSTLHGDC